MLEEQHFERIAKKVITATQAGIYCKKGLIKNTVGESPEDVAGFEYTVQQKNDVCYQYYVSNSPLTHITEPVPKERPEGMELFDNYEIDYKKAIRLFQQTNCGKQFTRISLHKPRTTPRSDEPFWYIKTPFDVTVAIGANTGTIYRARPFRLTKAS